ncbi:HPP family protein [Luteolibacter luteus]|uniref:HPP family protein n=1 Tax=Luteolibacter luteus TaxID=2728835 RepID=A0A858RIL9_9BACT|nr:HPP family protein [Luteolibacter luteus]QJE96269.1 HPP family protein [Luteolibacter luteus]
MRAILQSLAGGRAALPPRLPTRQILLAGLGGALAISLLAALTKLSGTPLVLGSFGASCVFIFGLPDAPFSQPRNVIGGHLISSATGLAVYSLFGSQAWALGLALGLAIILMFATRMVHAPAGSNPVIVFLSAPGWNFLLTPTLLGGVGLVLVALIYHHATNPGHYPRYWWGRDAKPEPA